MSLENFSLSFNKRYSYRDYSHRIEIRSKRPLKYWYFYVPITIRDMLEAIENKKPEAFKLVDAYLVSSISELDKSPFNLLQILHILFCILIAIRVSRNHQLLKYIEDNISIYSDTASILLTLNNTNWVGEAAKQHLANMLMRSK